MTEPVLTKGNTATMARIQKYKVGEHEWLDPSSSKCTADEYFKDISYIVKLNGNLILLTLARTTDDRGHLFPQQ